MVELVSSLNVDYSQVEAAAQNLTNENRELNMVLGQLITISNKYLETMCVQVSSHWLIF